MQNMFTTFIPKSPRNFCQISKRIHWIFFQNGCAKRLETSLQDICATYLKTTSRLKKYVWEPLQNVRTRSLGYMYQKMVRFTVFARSLIYANLSTNAYNLAYRRFALESLRNRDMSQGMVAINMCYTFYTLWNYKITKCCACNIIYWNLILTVH